MAHHLFARCRALNGDGFSRNEPKNRRARIAFFEQELPFGKLFGFHWGYLNVLAPILLGAVRSPPVTFVVTDFISQDGLVITTMGITLS